MQKHAMALGYFSLAVFCVHVGEHLNRSEPRYLPLMLITAATVAAVVGAAFFIAASINSSNS